MKINLVFKYLKDVYSESPFVLVMGIGMNVILFTTGVMAYRDEEEVKGIVIFMNGDDQNGFIFESITLDIIEGLLK